VAVEGLAAFIVTGTLYLAFVSRQFDLNGIEEALELDSGKAFSANHLLYRPLGLLLQESLKLVGVEIQTIFVLQFLTAAAGATALTLAYLLFRQMEASRFVAAAVTMGLGTSWAWWAFSTDAMYIPLAAVFVVAALIAFQNCVNERFISITGYLTGFAILVWEANVFLIPVFVIGFLLLHPASASRLRWLVRYVVASLLPVAAMYSMAALALRIATPQQFFAWVTSHGNGVGLPMWGYFDWHRIGNAAQTSADSIIHRNASGAVVMIGALALAAFAMAFWFRCEEWGKFKNAVWLALAYLMYMPFIVWWDPVEPKWFVIPNVFLAALTVHSFQTLRNRHLPKLALCLLVGTVLLTNLIVTIWPRRTDPNLNLALAGCVAFHLQPADAVITTDWDWGSYIEYFFKRREINLVAEAAFTGDVARTLRYAREQVRRVQRFNGNAYIIDFASQDRRRLEWLEHQTQLTSERLQPFQGEPAFECVGRTFRRVSRIMDVPAPPPAARLSP